MSKQHILVGKTIQSIKLADDKEAILFITDQGEVGARCDAECCSHTWIEHVELPALGVPALVTSVEDVDMPDLGSPNGYDVIEYYGCKIVTDKGEIVIDYRNESNGFYGGNLCWPADEHFYGGAFKQKVSTENWIDLI